MATGRAGAGVAAAAALARDPACAPLRGLLGSSSDPSWISWPRRKLRFVQSQTSARCFLFFLECHSSSLKRHFNGDRASQRQGQV